jgi:putative hemolysin
VKPLRSNALEVRLAAGPDEVAEAQALRYRIFYEEMGAKADPATAAHRLDADDFDACCDHLLAIDHSGRKPRVVGTYRLLRGAAARAAKGFYSASEYDLTPLAAHEGEVLELGRSCVDAAFRRGTMMLMWQGIAAYVVEHDIDIMFGCASLPGTDPSRFAGAIAYLHHFHLAPESLRPRAVAGRYVDMRLLPQHSIDEGKSLAELPPLLKGYIRLGGWVGDGAVIDHQFNTVDVCIVVETERLAARYSRHYIDRADRSATP